MKRIVVALWLILVTGALSQLNAQQNKDINAALAKKFDALIADIKEIDPSNQEKVNKAIADAKLDQILEQGLKAMLLQSKLDSQALEKEKKEYVKESTVKQQIDKDLLPLLARLPEPVSSLPMAAETIKLSDPDDIYSRYIEDVKAYQKGLEERARQELPEDMKDPQKMQQKGEQDAKNAMAELENNPMIQQMGGLEKLKNMTPAQREALAKQMTDKRLTDPYGATNGGGMSEGQLKFTEWLAKNPNDRARYERMSNQDKMAAYQKFLDKNGYADAPKSGNGNDTERARASISIAIDTNLNKIAKQDKAISDIVQRFERGINEDFDAKYAVLVKQYGTRIAALPVEKLGEYGHDRITYPVDISYQVILYSVEQQNAIALKEAWKRNLQAAKISIAEYNQLLSDASAKGELAKTVMAEKGMTPAAWSAAFCNTLIALAQDAKDKTAKASGWQTTYEEKVLHKYR